MPETSEELFRRAVAAADSAGRLAMPPVDGWETFPFEGELRVRPLVPLVDEETPRQGEDPEDCWRCTSGLEDAIWADDDWLVGSLPKPSGLPVVVLLYPREHHDIDDLPDHLAANLGPMLLRVEAAVRSVGDVGRVHIGRWGDGGAHLHLWFMARPARVPQLRGSFAAIWDDILPAVPEEVWLGNLAIVGRALATAGGRAYTPGSETGG